MKREYDARTCNENDFGAKKDYRTP